MRCVLLGAVLLCGTAVAQVAPSGTLTDAHGRAKLHVPEVPSTTFVDVTTAAGLDVIQYDPTDPVDPRGLIYMSGGAAAADYDDDGLVDLYITRFEKPHALMRNMGDGTFSNVTISAGLGSLVKTNGAAWADIDNDSDLDLFVTTIYSGRFLLYVNDGMGGFSEEAIPRGTALAGADTHLGQSVTFGDYDLDGYLDIHTCEWRSLSQNPGGDPSNSRLLRNLGAANPGHFVDATAGAEVVLDGYHAFGVFSFASRFSDLDEDGWPDLAMTGDFGTSRLFWNDGDGTFTDGTVAAGVGTDENGMGSALGDYDGDGRLDWFVSSIYDPPCQFVSCGWGHSGNRLYRNLGSRSFTDATDAAGVRDGKWGWGSAFFDYDHDADLDLAQTNGINFLYDDNDEVWNTDPFRFWSNDGTGIMTELSADLGLHDTGNGKGLLTFDYDQDGDLDLFVCNNADMPVLYRNDIDNGNDWLRVETEGWGGTPGVGARVEVTAEPGGATQVREVNCGSHFLGQSEMAAHFGLGSGGTLVDEVTVTWPISGTVQTLVDQPRNAWLTVVEPEPPLSIKVGGERNLVPRVVVTANPVSVTLDVTPGPFEEPLDWYVGTRLGDGPVIWRTPAGPSETARALLRAAPATAREVALFEGDIPEGTPLTVFVALHDGERIVARDFQSALVSSSEDAPPDRRREATQVFVQLEDALAR